MLTMNKMHFRKKPVKDHIRPKQNFSFSLRERDAAAVGTVPHCRKSPASNNLRNTTAGSEESAVWQFDLYRTVRQWLKARVEVMHAAWRMR